MHLRAKSVWDDYEDLIKQDFKKRGLDYKGKDKDLYKEELKEKRDLIMRQLLYTNALLAKIRTGGDYSNIESLTKYREYDTGAIRALRDRFGKVQPTPLTTLVRQLDRNLIAGYKQQQFETKTGKALKGTRFTADDIYKYELGLPPEYVKEAEGKGYFGKKLTNLRDWILIWQETRKLGVKGLTKKELYDMWMESGKTLTQKDLKDAWAKSRSPEELGLTEKDLLCKRLREIYANRKNFPEFEPEDMPFSLGGQVDSMKVMHHGGFVNKTGPVFAQKGEVIFPKGFAEGGMVSDLLEEDLPSLKNLTFKIDTSELKALLDKELKVEDIELKVEDKILEVEDKIFSVEDKIFSVEDKELKVEDVELKVEDKIFQVEDKTFSVDDVVLKVDDTPLKIDVGTIVSDISEAVREAVSNITVQTENAGGAVGADEFATLTETVNNVNDKIIALNRDMESKIEMLGDVSETSILNKVNGMINDSISNIVLEIRSSDTTIDNIRSEVQREKDLNNYRMSEIDKKIAEIYNVLL
jgi:hypothetical protein